MTLLKQILGHQRLIQTQSLNPSIPPLLILSMNKIGMSENMYENKDNHYESQSGAKYRILQSSNSIAVSGWVNVDSKLVASRRLPVVSI